MYQTCVGNRCIGLGRDGTSLKLSKDYKQSKWLDKRIIELIIKMICINHNQMVSIGLLMEFEGKVPFYNFYHGTLSVSFHSAGFKLYKILKKSFFLFIYFFLSMRNWRDMINSSLD